MNVTQFDFEDKLEITGLVLDETKTYDVDHDATIVEEDGTEGADCTGKMFGIRNASGWSPTLRVLWTTCPQYCRLLTL